MAIKGLKVLFVSAEASPFSAVGGLGQVAYFLPRMLLKMGVDVRIFTPRYGLIDERRYPSKMLVEGLKVPTGMDVGETGDKDLVCNVKVHGETKKGDPTVYFLENMEYFEKRANVYGYSDDHIRFGLLSRGALEFVKTGNFVPDVIHANDWHTGYLVNYLRDVYKDDSQVKRIATLLSVHNLHQGMFDFGRASELDYDDGKSSLCGFFTERYFKQNALKRGIIYADIINTVSETYAREIMTEEYGRGLDKLFKEVRGKIFGVLNGLDCDDFNPSTDKHIKKNFSSMSVRNRAENKTDLQKEFGLTVNPDVPVMAIWGRLDGQKGLDLLIDILPFILSEFDMQFIVMGGGDPSIHEAFEKLEKAFPGKVGTHLMPNFSLPRKIMAGADIFVLPSRYEPGGIVAMEAMRYGCVPVVRATGGLADTVTDFDPLRNDGTGFVFKSFSAMSLLATVVRALETYKNKKVWSALVRRTMNQDFSWRKSAQKYVDLYNRAIKFRREAILPNPPMAVRQTV